MVSRAAEPARNRRHGERRTHHGDQPCAPGQGRGRRLPQSSDREPCRHLGCGQPLDEVGSQGLVAVTSQRNCLILACSILRSQLESTGQPG